MSFSLPPPLGNDLNKGSIINATNWTFTALALIAVGVRLFGRLKLTHNTGWDDFWIVVAVVSFLNAAALVPLGNVDNLEPAAPEHCVHFHGHRQRSRWDQTTPISLR